MEIGSGRGADSPSVELSLSTQRAQPIQLHNLPLEIIRDILILARTHTSPVRLSHITAYLRRVALNIQLIWATVRIESDSPKDVDRFITYLERSGVAPLTLKITFNHYIRPGRDGHASRIIGLIRPRMHHIRSVDLVTSNEKFDVIVLGQFDAPTPILEHLAISSSSGFLPASFLGGSAPYLKELIIHSSAMRIDSDFLMLGRLEMLTLNFGTDLNIDDNIEDEEECIRLLQRIGVVIRHHSSSLVHLDIRTDQLADQEWEQEEGSGDQAVPYDYLETLFLRGFLSTRLLSHITAPRLIHFTFRIGNTDSDPEDTTADTMSQDTVDFLYRHSNTLEEVAFDLAGRLEITPDTLEFPRLKTLKINISGSLPPAINTPVLSSLNLHLYDDDIISWSELILLLDQFSDSLHHLRVEWGADNRGNLGEDSHNLPRLRFPSLESLDFCYTTNIEILTSQIDFAPRLKRLILDSQHRDAYFHDQPWGDISFPALEQFHCILSSQFLPGIIAPILRVVNLQMEPLDADPWPQDHVAAFFIRHSSSIVELTLDLPANSPPLPLINFRHLLEPLRSLEIMELSIDKSLVPLGGRLTPLNQPSNHMPHNQAQDIWEELARKDLTGAFVYPQLHHITFHKHSKYPLAAAALENMVTSRSTNNGPIESLRIIDAHTFPAIVPSSPNWNRRYNETMKLGRIGLTREEAVRIARLVPDFYVVPNEHRGSRPHWQRSP